MFWFQFIKKIVLAKCIEAICRGFGKCLTVKANSTLVLETM